MSGGTSYYNFKKIAVVPTANDFIDIILSKTQRKTPTVVHPNYSIGRIRSFYMRKVKFSQDAFNEKLEAMLSEFPKLDDIHPFYSDLMNVLYDKDHYKLALGQLNTARHLIEHVAKDYVRLLKFGDSLYRCKQLKKAALGRMATIMKRQKDPLAYLEQVRQHLARLPSIDPNTRTLLVCGYPNVGKSSFMNKVTRADVEVQPYAFTTKSLFVGHMDYKYLRWQVIDTPGILDHPLEDRNTIEMQSVTAMAHLRAAILFFVDLSGQCGYSVKEQIALFHSIKPLFNNKPTLLVVNKIDVRRYEDLEGDEKVLVDEVLADSTVTMVQQSCWTDDGVMDVRAAACEKLLTMRVDSKMKGHKVTDVLQKLNVAMPGSRDEKTRPAFIPERVAEKRALNIKYDMNDENRAKLERDLETENGGAGVYNIDLKKKYMLAEDEWKYDPIPEIMDGKNVADFIDPEINARLEALEREEERLEAEGAYVSEDEMEDSDEEALKEAATVLRAKKAVIVQENNIKRGKNRPKVPTKFTVRKTNDVADLEERFAEREKDIEGDAIRGRSKRSRSESRPADEAVRAASQARAGSRDRSKSVAPRDRSVAGLGNKKQKLSAEAHKRLGQRERNLFAKAGEGDRAIRTKMPKHLFSGKRGMGSTDRR
ncbi:Nucleolar GTP-binding protein 1 [Sorochytrium milnesiophthora]